MTYSSDTILGMSLDEGAALFVKESAHAEGVAAVISNVQLQTSKFAGASARREFIIPQMTSQNYAMQAAENHVPDLRLMFQQFKEASMPADGLAYLDKMLEMFGGTTSASAMRIIPAETFEQSAYKAADGLVGAMHGVFTYMGFQHAKPTAGAPLIAPAITVEQFQSLKFGGISASGLLILSADEQDAMKEMMELTRLWEATGKGEMLSTDATSVVLSRLGVVPRSEGWRSKRISVSPGGVIFADDEPIRTERQARDAFPDVPYGPKKKPLWKSVLDHNLWAGSAPDESKLFRIKEPDEIVASWKDSKTKSHSASVITEDGVRSWITNYDPDRPDKRSDRITDEASYKSTRSEADREERADSFERVRRNVEQGKSAMFGLKWGGIVDYVSVPILQGENDADMAHRAWTILRTKHLALTSRRDQAVFQAKQRINARTSVITLEAIRPAFLAKAASIHYDLVHAPAPHHIVLTKPTDDNLDDVMEEMADIVAQYEETAINAIDTHDPLSDGYSVIASGRFAATPTEMTVMLPVLGRGVTPARVALTKNGYEFLRTQGVAVVLDEPAVTVGSPIRSMIMTAALKHLEQQMNGYRTPYTLDPYDPLNPTGIGHTRPCLRSILHKQLNRYVKGFAHQLNVVTPDNVKALLEKAVILTDAKLMLDHMEDLYNAIINRDDWVYMIQGLMISLLLANGASVTVNMNGTEKPVSTVSAGVAPPEVTRFIFNEVLNDVVRTPAYKEVAAKALERRSLVIPDLTSEKEINNLVRGEVILARMRRGAKFLVSLLDGSEPLCPIIPVGTLQHMVDAQYGLDLMRTISTLLDRDYLATVDSAKMEAPWECAQWATQFSTFAVHVKSTPIKYQARDVAREVVSDSQLPELAGALMDAGFDWTEIAPEASFVKADNEKDAGVLPSPIYMEGFRGGGLFTDAPVSHQMMRITTTVPMYDVEAYNLLRAYITTATPRSYWAQPIDSDVSARYTIKPGMEAPSYLASLLGMSDSEWTRFKVDGFSFEKCPVLADTAIMIPYIASFLTKPATSREVTVHQCIDVDKEQSLAVTSGVIITPGDQDTRLISYGNGLAINMRTKASTGTAMDWIGS